MVNGYADLKAHCMAAPKQPALPPSPPPKKKEPKKKIKY